VPVITAAAARVQLEAMVRELQEKGEGQAELADAHAAWQAQQDTAALAQLRRCLKYGFAKGRKRLGAVRGRCVPLGLHSA
jgi:hypothetical protein